MPSPLFLAGAGFVSFAPVSMVDPPRGHDTFHSRITPIVVLVYRPRETFTVGRITGHPSQSGVACNSVYRFIRSLFGVTDRFMGVGSRSHLNRWSVRREPRNRGSHQTFMATIYTLSFWMGAVLVGNRWESRRRFISFHLGYRPKGRIRIAAREGIHRRHGCRLSCIQPSICRIADQTS